MKTTVYVMRHGEVHNPEQVLYGRLPDFHLSDRGRTQAAAVADWLADRDITYIVASPLERAQENSRRHRGAPRAAHRHRSGLHRIVEHVRRAACRPR